MSDAKNKYVLKMPLLHNGLQIAKQGDIVEVVLLVLQAINPVVQIGGRSFEAVIRLANGWQVVTYPENLRPLQDDLWRFFDHSNVLVNVSDSGRMFTVSEEKLALLLASNGKEFRTQVYKILSGKIECITLDKSGLESPLLPPTV